MDILQVAGRTVSLEKVLESLQRQELDEDNIRRLQRDAKRQRTFLSARGEMLRECGDADRTRVMAAEEEAGKEAGHVLTIKGVTLDDTGHCSCGWVGKGHWDGVDFEYNDWLWHLLKAGVKISYPATGRQAA